jgi:glycosyltransferase involved in cell wall biosynthesis
MPDRTATAELALTDWAGVVVLCAANSWDDVKLADRHMAERLTAHAPVLYVDPAISHLTRFHKSAVAGSLRGPRLRLAAPRIARYTPLVAPKPDHPAMVALTSRMVRRQLSRAVRRLGGDVHAVVSTWVFADVYGVLGEEHRVYWWQDDPAGGAAHWGASADRLQAGEERLARSSDLLVAVDGATVEDWRARGVRSEYLPNGCDAPYFASVDEVDAASDLSMRGPVAGFIGHMNSRTDLALLEAVANTGMSLLLIGPKEASFEPARFAALAGRPNVAYIGPRPFEQLPSYMKLIDVGLVPYGATEFNQRSFPMKTLEYLAAGRPVVATSLPALRSLRTDLVTLADTPADFAASVLGSATLARDPALVRRRREFAASHSWAKRAERLAELLGLPGTRARDVVAPL